MIYTGRGGLLISTEKIPYEGTLVAAQLDFSVPRLLEEALRFDGRLHRPMDFVELRYEQSNQEDLLFKISRESSSFGAELQVCQSA